MVVFKVNMNNMKKNGYIVLVSSAFLVCIVLLAIGLQNTRFSKSFARTRGLMETFSMANGSMPMVGVPEMAMDVYADNVASTGKALFVPPGIPAPSAGQTAAEVDQKIIKNGSLTVTVEDVSSAISRYTTLAKELEGFVQNSDVYEGSDGQTSGTIILRVPASRFEEALERVKQSVSFVSHEQTSGQDVTESYTDLAAHLRNAEAQEQVFLAVLDEARSVTDILEVQRELTNIRGQIESYKGQLQYLENQTSYATLSIYLSEQASVRVPTKEFRLFETIKMAAQALIVVVQSLVIALIWFVVVGGGILLPLGLLAWIIILVVRRHRTKSKPAPRSSMKRS